MCVCIYTHICLYICIHVYTWASQVMLVVKNLPANAGDIRDADSIPGSGRSPIGGNSNPLQYSCLENPMDRGAWRATVYRVTKSQTWLKQLNTDACITRLDRANNIPEELWTEVHNIVQGVANKSIPKKKKRKKVKCYLRRLYK